MSFRFAPLASLALVGAASALPQTTNEGFLECVDVLHRLTGEATGDLFGWVSAPVPDVTGDGIQELLVGAIGFDGALNNRGAAYLYDGATAALIYKRVGGVSGQALGTSVSAAGDVDGDTVEDFIAGGPGTASQIGQARVYSGATGNTIWIIKPGVVGDSAGATVAGVGDIDGDGFDDLALGAPLDDSAGMNAGRVYIVSGIDGTTLLWTIDGESAGDQFGAGMGTLGDVTGDGKAELAVGAPGGGATGRGRAYVFDLAAQQQLYLRNPEISGSGYGQFFVYGVGDLNADGWPDLYVSDFADGSGRGKAYFYDGPTGALLYTLTGSGGDGFGIGRGVGDVNGDGHDDVVMGSWTNSTGAGGAGQCEIFSGSDGTRLRRMTSTVAGEALGFDAHGIGDVNGDGRPDYVLTAANKANNRGAVYVVAGGAQVQSFGAGKAGTGAITPEIMLTGCPELGSGFGLDVSNVRGGAFGVLVVGDQELALPYKGGTVYTNFGFVSRVHVASGAAGVAGAGSASFAFTLPSDPALVGLTFVSQAGYSDPGATQGLALTAAVRFRLYD